MPVSFTKIPFPQLLCHQGAYEIIDAYGRENFEGWDIVEFEKSILGCGSIKFVHNLRDANVLCAPLAVLDKTMPFLKFGEPGQHYAYELFLSSPDHWDTRGTPLFWAYAARQFTFDPLPMSEEAFTKKYKAIAASFGIPYGKEEYAYIKRFAAGGMSSGMVGGRFVEEALPLLLHRLRKY